MEYDDQELGHEEILEAVLRHLLLDGDTCDLEQMCLEVGLPWLYECGDEPVYIRGVHTYSEGGVLTCDRGLLLGMSDGSEVALTVKLNRRPYEQITVRLPVPDSHSHGGDGEIRQPQQPAPATPGRGDPPVPALEPGPGRP
jgi:hypothetical protein